MCKLYELLKSSGTDASEEDLACFDEHSCERVFIFKGNKPLINGKQYVILEGGEASAVLTSTMTEKEVAEIKAKHSDSIISVYRTL